MELLRATNAFIFDRTSSALEMFLTESKVAIKDSAVSTIRPQRAIKTRADIDITEILNIYTEKGEAGICCHHKVHDWNS